MEEKIYFINEYRSGTWSMTDLCAACSISRTLGYKYLERYQENGVEGLLERSRTPLHSPNKMNEKSKPIRTPILGYLTVGIGYTSHWQFSILTVFPSLPDY